MSELYGFKKNLEKVQVRSKSESAAKSHIVPTLIDNNPMACRSGRYDYTTRIIPELANWNVVVLTCKCGNINQNIVYFRGSNTQNYLIDALSSTVTRAGYYVDWANNSIRVRWVDGKQELIQSFVQILAVYGLVQNVDVVDADTEDEPSDEGEDIDISDLTNEVQGIRIGADGTIYESAGEAVRAQYEKLAEMFDLQDLEEILQTINNTVDTAIQQIETAGGLILDPTLTQSGQAADAKVTGDVKIDLNNSLEINRYSENNNVLTLPSLFEHGSRTGENAVSALTYRITSKSKISVENEETYYVANGFRIRSYVWNKDTGSYIGANNWTSSAFTLNPSREYMINIARVTEDTSEVADIAYFAEQVYRKSPNVRNDYIKEIVSTEQTTRMDGDYLPCAFRRGSYGSDGKYVEADNRICTINTVEVDAVHGYTIADGFECRVTSVNDDGSVIASQVVTQTLTLNPNKKYQITIKRAVESDVIENINELYSAVKHGTPVILYLPCKLIHGSRGTNGDLYTTGYDYRVTSSDKFKVTRRTEYVISDGFKCRLTSFDDNGDMLATQSNIVGKLTLNSDRNYVITIFRTTEDSTEVADIEQFKQAICRDNSGLNKGHLRIMVFGHSYSADSWQYVPFLLQKYGITCEIYLYYRGNDSINRLVAEWNETGDTGWDDFGIGHIRRYCHIDTRYCDSWDSSGGLTGYSPKMVLELAASEGKLDLITLQTAPTEVYFTKAPSAPDPRKGYEPYVREAIELINASYKDTYTLGWFCSYTRILPYEGNTTRGYPAVSGNEFDNRIGCLKAAETIWKAEPFEMIIPAAAAVFNARTNQSLASTNVSAIGNLWYSDAVHLQAGIPSYIANLTVLQSIFNKFFPECSVLGEQTRITDTLALSWNALMPSIHGSVMSTSEELYELAQKCAVLACEHPFDITPIYDVSDTTELEFFDTHSDRYWADALIDTSLIQNGQVTLSEQSGDA